MTRILHKENTMAERRFEVELPEEVLAGFGWRDAEVPYRLREALVVLSTNNA